MKQEPIDKDKLREHRRHFNELLEVMFKKRDRTRVKNIIRELDEKLPNRRIKLVNQLLGLISPAATQEEWAKLEAKLGKNWCHDDPQESLLEIGEYRLQAKKEKVAKPEGH